MSAKGKTNATMASRLAQAESDLRFVQGAIKRIYACAIEEIDFVAAKETKAKHLNKRLDYVRAELRGLANEFAATRELCASLARGLEARARKADGISGKLNEH